MKKTLLCLLLAALIAMSACGGEADQGSETSASPESSDTTTPESTGYTDDLGEYDFKDETFSIYTRTTPLFYPYLDRQEATGDLIDDAVYNRNRKLEDRFNFKFDEQYYDYTVEGNDAPRKLLLAGDDTYDLQEGRCIYLFNYASEGFMYTLDELPQIDPSKPYWNKQLYDDLSVYGEHYFAIGAFNISAYDFTHVMLFNKGLVDDLKLEDPYALVRSGKWTFDKYGEMARAAVRDLDGNSVLDDNDQYGYLSLAKQVMPGFWIAAGVTSVHKNKDGAFEYTAPTDQKFVEVCQKIISLNWADNIWHRVPISVDKEEEMQLFCEGHSLFANSSCFQLSSIRDSETDFGILPYPKWDESQDKYYSRIEGCELFGVPKTNTNPEMAAVILEAMACESMNNVIPAYYDVALKVKFTRDNDSAEMLDLAFENRVFDYGDTLLCTEFRDGVMRPAFADSNENIVSTLESVKNKCEAKLDEYNKAFQALK